MAEDRDRDLEIVDLAAAYTLYAATLINLANTMNRGPKPELEKVEQYAGKLSGHLARCNLKADVPTIFASSKEIGAFLEGSALVTELASQLAGQYSRQEETLFLLASSIGGLAATSDDSEIDATKIRSLPIRLSPTPTICIVSPWTAGKGRRRRIEEAIRLILDCSENRTGV